MWISDREIESTGEVVPSIITKQRLLTVYH